MMSRTHVAIGIASSLAILQPTNVEEFVLSVVGGAAGGIVCDVDALKDDYQNDALIGQIIGFVSLILLLVYYWLTNHNVIVQIIHNKISLIGLAVFVVMYIIGYFSKHRTITHSFLGMIAFCGSIYCICPKLIFSYVIGFATHLVLDLMNKREIYLLYPFGKGICFKLCYAGKTANTVLMYLGIVFSLGLSVYFLFIR